MRSLFLLCALLLAGCEIQTDADIAVDPAEEAAAAQERADGRTDAEVEALEAGERGTDVVTAESPDSVEPAAGAPTFMLRRLVLGDRACYIDLQPEGADTETRLADFGVCSQAEVEDLVGQRVQIEVGQANVMAESCEGNPECTDTESVELITRLFASE